MNKKIKALATSTLLVSSFSTHAFNDGDVLSFDPGVTSLTYYGGSLVTSGSYFSMDLNGDGVFSSRERTAITPGSDGGIVLGALQPSASIDQPWLFFGNFGTHQTTTVPITQNPDGTLDFSGWEVKWFDIPVPLGSNVGATVECGGKLSCSPTDRYIITYTATVTSGPFQGVGYQLHLEHVDTLPSIHLSLTINAGSTQECTSTGGHNVTADADVTALNGAELDSIHWTVDGQSAGMGLNISPFLSLGTHTISATAIGTSGTQDTATTSVSIVDTTSPTISAAFINKRTNTEVTTIESKNSSSVNVSMSATDICDSSPAVSAIGGFNLVDGDTLKIQGNLNKVELTTSALEMRVRAKDSSGNYSYSNKTLSITP